MIQSVLNGKPHKIKTQNFGGYAMLDLKLALSIKQTNSFRILHIFFAFHITKNYLFLYIFVSRSYGLPSLSAEHIGNQNNVWILLEVIKKAKTVYIWGDFLGNDLNWSFLKQVVFDRSAGLMNMPGMGQILYKHHSQSHIQFRPLQDQRNESILY